MSAKSDSSEALPDGAHPRKDFEGRLATVMGLGRFGGGLGAALWLHRRGARVRVTDMASATSLRTSIAALPSEIETAFGEHPTEWFEHTDWLVPNPAVPVHHPLLERAREKGIRVRSEVALFLEHNHRPWIGITGTQGKSSTAHFTTQLLRNTIAPSTDLAGNVGASLLELCEPSNAATANPAPPSHPNPIIIELSSYQLEALQCDPPDWTEGGQRASAVAITNVLCDHLARHKTWAAYARAKCEITQLAAHDAAVFVPDLKSLDPFLSPETASSCIRFGPRSQSLTLSDTAFVSNLVSNNETLGDPRDLHAPGDFQKQNALLALALARHMGATPAALAQSLHSLQAPAHRLEDLGEHRGLRVWDNGVSTTPDSTLAAVSSLGSELGVVLLGGADKDLDWKPLHQQLQQLGVLAITFGADGQKIADQLPGVSTYSGSLEAATRKAFELCPTSKCLLFSPACASFDAFDNFRQRALAFRELLNP